MTESVAASESAASASILIIGVGGLGRAMVAEALERDFAVSVLVRHPDRLDATLTAEERDRLHRVIVGDGRDPRILAEAMVGIDVVLSGRGADPELAVAVATAVAAGDPHKLVWPAGSTNVRDEDGITPNWIRLMAMGSWAKAAYDAHQACIDAIRAAGITSVIFCPGVMSAAGHRSPDVASTVRIDRDGGGFVSYEDAAWVMIEGALGTRFDDQLVSAGTTR